MERISAEEQASGAKKRQERPAFREGSNEPWVK